jgi:putative RNA 2'-phosphotransferase
MGDLKKVSKFLSYILRHSPETIGIAIDANGWVQVDELIAKVSAGGHVLTSELLKEIVAASDKQRFAFDKTGTRIRASQGHSINVDLQYEPALPPRFLYHGTVAEFIDAIKAGGLQKMERRHVHLSPNIVTAKNVGGRRGKPVVLTILAGRMNEAGHKFFVSANGVWLCEVVPPKYIDFKEE